MKDKLDSISLHEVKVFRAFHGAQGKWFTNRGVAEQAGIAERTARAHTLKLVRAGLVERAALFPEYKFRWSEKADTQESAYFSSLVSAAKIFEA